MYVIMMRLKVLNNIFKSKWVNPSSKSDASSGGSVDERRRIESIEKVCIGGAMQRKGI